MTSQNVALMQQYFNVAAAAHRALPAPSTANEWEAKGAAEHRMNEAHKAYHTALAQFRAAAAMQFLDRAAAAGVDASPPAAYLPPDLFVMSWAGLIAQVLEAEARS